MTLIYAKHSIRLSNRGRENCQLQGTFSIFLNENDGASFPLWTKNNFGIQYDNGESAFAIVGGRVEDFNLPLPQDKIDTSNPGRTSGSAEELQKLWPLNVEA